MKVSYLPSFFINFSISLDGCTHSEAAWMPLVPNGNEFFVPQKTRSQKCTRMCTFRTDTDVRGVNQQQVFR